MSTQAIPRARPGSTSGAPSPALPAQLRRNAPLVPTDTAAGRSLAAVIAILTFLAGLCAGAAEMVAANAAQWQGDVAQEVTIQIRPSPGRDVEADLARAAGLARRSPVSPRRGSSRRPRPSGCWSPGSAAGSTCRICRCPG